MDVSPEAVELAADAGRWASAHLPAIEVVMEAYLRSGIWPNADELQPRLDAAGSHVDLWSFSDLLRGERRFGVGSVDPPDDRINLRLRAWHEVSGLNPYVEFVLQAVRTAVRRYLDGSSVLTAADLVQLQSLDDFSWRLVMGLVEREAFYFLAGAPDLTLRAWECQIDKPRIRRFLKVTNAWDYLLAIAQYFVDIRPPHTPVYFRRPLAAPLLPYEPEVTNVTNNFNTTIQTAGMVNINPETVNVIQSHIEAIGTREPALAQALARLAEALDATEFTGEQRDELRAYVEDLAADLQQPPERRRWSRIKATAKAVGEFASLAPTFLEAWNHVSRLIPLLNPA
jgi:hypothetical protein